MPLLLHVGADAESCALINIHDRRPRRIATFPEEILGKWLVGSQDGWISLLDDHSEVSILNPLTRERINLPSISTMPQIETVYNPDGSLHGFFHSDYGHIRFLTPDEFRSISFKKIVLSSTSTADCYTVMAIMGCCCFPAFATAGGGWTILSDQVITDIIYRHGKFLLLSIEGDLWAIDPTLPSPELRMIAEAADPEDEDVGKFLVDSSHDLLLVWCLSSYDTLSFKVWKFDADHAAWVIMKSLGDRSLFLGTCHSISLSVREIPELKPNCIYVSRNYWDHHDPQESQEHRDVGVFNMDDETFDRYCPTDSRLTCHTPLWFTPSLT